MHTDGTTLPTMLASGMGASGLGPASASAATASSPLAAHGTSRAVTVARAALRRAVRSMVLSMLTSAIVYVAHQLAQGETPASLFASLRASLDPRKAAGAGAGAGAGARAAHKAAGPAVAAKHRDAALACLEDPGEDGLDRVGGLDHVKEEMRGGVLRALRYPHVFFDAATPSLRPPCRLLFCGPPGTGKTMLARALAAESKAHFMNVTLSTLEDKYLGESPKIVRAVFRTAAERAPCILFFDEIDGLMRRRREDDHSAVYGMKTEFLQHLEALDGAVVVIGCTNALEALDPALRRRLPDVYHIGLPTHAQRVDILRRITHRESPPPAEATLRAVAAASDGCSGSDLRETYKRACARRLRRHLPRVRLDAARSGSDVLHGLPPLNVDDWQAQAGVAPSAGRGPGAGAGASAGAGAGAASVGAGAKASSVASLAAALERATSAPAASAPAASGPATSAPATDARADADDEQAPPPAAPSLPPTAPARTRAHGRGGARASA